MDLSGDACLQTKRFPTTMSKTIDEILEKPEARPRIYAYSIADKAHKGLLKVGQTTRDVKQRVAEQLKTADASRTTPSSWMSRPSATTARLSATTTCATADRRRASRTSNWSGCAARPAT
jgi:hypothetical protein